MAASGDDILLECLQKIFSNWKALRLGVENRAGGVQSRDKAEWIPTAFVEWMVTNADLEKFEIEDFIADVLNQEFNLIVDDGSLPTTAQQVYAAYKLHQNGDLDQLKQTSEKLPPVNPYFEVPLSSRNPDDVDMVSPHSSEEDEDDELASKEGASGASAPKSSKVETVVDEDGEVWQVVKSSKPSKKPSKNE